MDGNILLLTYSVMAIVIATLIYVFWWAGGTMHSGSKSTTTETVNEGKRRAIVAVKDNISDARSAADDIVIISLETSQMAQSLKRAISSVKDSCERISATREEANAATKMASDVASGIAESVTSTISSIRESLEKMSAAQQEANDAKDAAESAISEAAHQHGLQRDPARTLTLPVTNTLSTSDRTTSRAVVPLSKGTIDFPAAPTQSKATLEKKSEDVELADRLASEGRQTAASENTSDDTPSDDLFPPAEPIGTVEKNSEDIEMTDNLASLAETMATVENNSEDVESTDKLTSPAEDMEEEEEEG
uniref:Uncharacterized protein n=1 Tax=Trachysalambria curvirostris nimavirus TaxID=2984282 RepID=A0A9C7BR72_9VIRU|nr:MAG: hypothetical protein [Trachysalambria curvirostris nimavirus]